MQKHYSIALPKQPGLPILAVDYKTDSKKEVSLKQAKDMVFGAILRGDYVMLERCDFIMDVISIVDQPDVIAAHDKWIEVNGDLPLSEAMKK